jgi:hypothetical protein
MTDFDGSLGSPGPPLFTAITRNSYSSPSTRFGAVPLVLFPAISAAFSHGLFAKIYNFLIITPFDTYSYTGSA